MTGQPYVIGPGSALDAALNVVAAVSLGEPGVSEAELDAALATVQAGGRAAVMALGLRCWSAGDGQVLPSGRRADADEFTRRWYGGAAAA